MLSCPLRRAFHQGALGGVLVVCWLAGVHGCCAPVGCVCGRRLCRSRRCIGMSWVRVVLPMTVSVLLLSGCASSGSSGGWQRQGNLPFPLATDTPASSPVPGGSSVSGSPSASRPGASASPEQSSPAVVSVGAELDARRPDLLDVGLVLERSGLRWVSETEISQDQVSVLSAPVGDDQGVTVAVFGVIAGVGSLQEAVDFYAQSGWVVDSIRENLAFLTSPGQYMLLSRDGSVVVSVVSPRGFAEAELLLPLMLLPVPGEPVAPSAAPSGQDDSGSQSASPGASPAGSPAASG